MSKNLKSLLAVAGVLVVASVDANAASLLGTETATAIGTGFTNLQDTVLDVVETAFPYFLGIIGIMAAPKVVKTMANKI